MNEEKDRNLMSLQPGDTCTPHNFGLQIDGVMVEYLQKVNCMNIEQDVADNQQVVGRDKAVTKQGPGPRTVRAGTVTVVRGNTRSSAFSEWINDSVVVGSMSQARKNAAILMVDERNSPLKRFNMRNAWCSEVVDGTADCGGATAPTESVTIAYEELVIE